MVVYAQKQFNIDLDINLIAKQQPDKFIDGHYISSTDVVTDRLVQQAFASPLRLFDPRDHTSPVPMLLAVISNPGVTEFTQDVSPIYDYAAPITSEEKWTREATVTLCTKGALV